MANTNRAAEWEADRNLKLKRQLDEIRRESSIKALNIFYRTWDKNRKDSSPSIRRIGLVAKTLGLIAHDRLLDSRDALDFNPLYLLQNK